MQTYIERDLEQSIKSRLGKMPSLAILGPRQCGKSTLALRLLDAMPEAIYLDLESPRELRKLNDAEAFLEDNSEYLICIDEIQRKPDLFPVLRSLIDKDRRNGRFLILGSASPELIRQSAESLAGRISYYELSPLILKETGKNTLKNLWLKGGLPLSFLEEDEVESLSWRMDFIRTYLERDIPALEPKIPVPQIQLLWNMCAHVSGQVLNYSKLASSLDVSSHTIKNYINLLAQTYMVRLLPPLHANLKKRLIKSPKLYIRDTGILHALLDIESKNDLYGHPEFGASWESFALENILSALPASWKAYFYRTSSGNEVDLVLQKGQKRILVEFKASTAPDLKKGYYICHEDLKPTESWIISPIEESYIYDSKHNIHAGNPIHILKSILSSG